MLAGQVSCYWPMEKQWFEGALEAYDPKTKAFRVRYDDGDFEDGVTLPDKTVKLLS